MRNSPFSDRTMITDPSRFFGRTIESQKIYNALASPTPQCVSIIGERRIGRSSLLQHILRSYPQNLPQPEKCRFAYLDLSRDTCRHPHQFYAEVAQAFANYSGNSLSPQEFDDWLAIQNPQQTYYYILLLDEFNVLQRRRKKFDDDFYDGLRSRANSGELTLVLATHIPLANIALANNFSSTFFGIFTPVDLLGFRYKEAMASIYRPVNPSLGPKEFAYIGQWTKEDAKEIYHPLKLNIAADLIWQALSAPEYEKLKETYDQTISHVFGTEVHNLRSRQQRLNRITKGGQWLMNGIYRFTGEKPYLLLIILLVIVLLLVGVINLDQIIAGLLEGAGVPTLTPIPSPTP